MFEKENMNYLYLEQTFDSFCKKVIRNESIDAFREIAVKTKHEVQLSALPSNALSDLCYSDCYYPYTETYPVLGYTIEVKDIDLIDILQFIVPQQRSIILLFYFLGLNDVEIGKLLGISRNAVRNRRLKALNKLKSLLDAKGYEP